MIYNWQFPDWPNFQFDPTLHRDVEREFLIRAAKNKGAEDILTSADQQETILNLLVREALKSSEIEGEMISRVDLVSSVKKKLGLQSHPRIIKDKRSIGIAEALVDSRLTYSNALSETHLWQWHRAILSHSAYISLGQWRSHEEPMQIVSGSLTREVVHFEAPPSSEVPREMQQFIKWFNESVTHPLYQNPIIRSAVAHLYFESIHPFEDGNGRIGRILAEKSLSQSLGYPILMSLSHAIEKDKKQYYQALKNAQRTLEIDSWITYFGSMVLQAQHHFYETLHFTVRKTRFLDKIKGLLDEKQTKVIYKMLEEDEEFKEGMNAAKFMSITKVSKATATRSLSDMIEKQVLIATGKGRSTNYQLNF